MSHITKCAWPQAPSKAVFHVCVCVQVLARARERGDGEECGLEEEEEDSGDSSEEEDIVTEFPISNGGNSSLAEVSSSLSLIGLSYLVHLCIGLKRS